jgi:WD40 repeat protein
LIACNLDGLRFWDVANRELVGVIPGEGGVHLALHPDSQSLFVSGAKGLRRLELALDLPNREVRVGAIEQWWPTELSQISLSRDGQTLAAADLLGSRVLLFDARDPAKPKAIGPGNGVKSVSLSPDGRWVAGGAWSGTSVKVWDTGSGGLLQELPLAGASTVAFSPDGQRLMTANAAVCQLWETASWKVVATLPREHTGGAGCVMAISAAGQTAAVTRGRNSGTTLIELASGRELAALPEGVPLGFSADGSHLAMCIEDAPSLLVWDLRRVREELAAMKLDWELPPFPTPAADSGPMQPHLRLVTKP